MLSHATKSPLNADERVQRRRLILSDTISLASLFVITAVLAVLTNVFYKSYATHQAALAHRWQARGELDLKTGMPDAAIDALRSALIYAPSLPISEQRSIEIQLAGALASAGHIQEATSYFNTLAESEPGSGIINLQLARLAARQGNVAQALEDYHRAIYGTWEGNGYFRRREVRMELINFLIARQRYADARNELLVASGNAPESDRGFLLEIAGVMEQAFDPADALRLYRIVSQHPPPSQAALEGAGRTAFQLGRYVEAKQYLERAVSGLDASRASPTTLEPVRGLLRETTRLLSLYPSPQLGLGAQSERILMDRQIAHDRLAACVSSTGAGQNSAPGTKPGIQSAPQASISAQSSSPNAGTGVLRGSLESLASRFRHSSQKPPQSVPPLSHPPVDPLDALSARWTQQPDKMTISALEGDPELAQSTIQLVYDTEKITQQVCGAPSGDDALLLKIAEAPNVVGQE